MVGVNFDPASVKRLAQRLRRLGPASLKRTAKSVRRQAQAILKDSRDNYVPVDDAGALRDSGMIDAAVTTQGKVEVTISFGREEAQEYAIAVHEHLSEHSPHSWKVAEAEHGGVKFTKGGPKYLELPLMAATAAGRFEAEVVRDLKPMLEQPDTWEQEAQG